MEPRSPWTIKNNSFIPERLPRILGGRALAVLSGEYDPVSMLCTHIKYRSFNMLCAHVINNLLECKKYADHDQYN